MIYIYNDQEFKDPASFNCIKMATALISGIHGNKILMQAVSVHSQQLQHASTENFTAPLKRRITIVKPRIAQQQRQVGVQTVKTATGT